MDLHIRWMRTAMLMLLVAPIVTSVRALLVIVGVAEPGFYWVFFAIGGTLSGLGMLLLAWATWKRRPFWWVVAGAVVALVGHNALGATPAADYGPALVQLGTGLVLWPWRKWAIAAGGVAAIGAVARHGAPLLGNMLLLAGAIGLFIAIWQAARAPDMHIQT